MVLMVIDGVVLWIGLAGGPQIYGGRGRFVGESC